MLASHEPAALKQFLKQRWTFQQTFKTPLERLGPFVAAILDAHGPLESGRVTLTNVVFEPKHFLAMLERHRLGSACSHGLTITAERGNELPELLEATFADWIDFLFVPTPGRFALFADHDEYTTLFAARKGNLSRMENALSRAGFARVDDYRRTW